ncbi:hypothetical protein BJV78DRAFT_1276093 [Lactifluus subvellereus]|nr:hypothetical protein BJV78DRAFT_1276093 [Lactifluus subvellereus]
MSQSQQDPDPFEDPPKVVLGAIVRHETWWVEHQEALERAGYMLRPRYHPSWRPSWAGTKKFCFDCEDGLMQPAPLSMDATRISDGRYVILKRLANEDPPYELQINRLFSMSASTSGSRNHCAQLLDVIALPNDPPIMVHPLLRPFDDPPLRTYGEFVALFSQVREGLQFMHENNVAHRDFTELNIMLDPSDMYPESFHPINMERSRDLRHTAKVYSRTRRPTRYLLVGFKNSRQYDPVNGPPLDTPLGGGDKPAPEYKDGTTPCNPFLTDVYYLGDLIRTHYIKACKYRGFDFMKPLVAAMVHNDPTKRPDMAEVGRRFAVIKGTLSTWKLRSRIARNNEVWPAAAWRSVGQMYSTVGYFLSRKAAIPEPK